MKKKAGNLVIGIIFLAGLSLLLYPSVSDYWNSFHASRAVAAYAQEVADLNGAEYDRLLEAARDLVEDLKLAAEEAAGGTP